MSVTELACKCRTIAAATGCMARAARRSLTARREEHASSGARWRERLQRAALTALTPLQPTLVSALNIAATEVRAPWRKPSLLGESKLWPSGHPCLMPRAPTPINSNRPHLR